MENLPILQDFVPYRARCPKTDFHWKKSKNGLSPLIQLRIGNSKIALMAQNTYTRGEYTPNFKSIQNISDISDISDLSDIFDISEVPRVENISKFLVFFIELLT